MIENNAQMLYATGKDLFHMNNTLHLVVSFNIQLIRDWTYQHPTPIRLCSQESHLVVYK